MKQLRKDFPLLHQQENSNNPLIYFDNAATTQKPQVVIDAVSNFYSMSNANIGRGIYALAEKATFLYEEARDAVANFIGAHKEEIAFTQGATAGINTVAHSWAASHLKPGDEIVVTIMEHHSNIIPWQQLAIQQGLVIHYVPLLVDGTLDMKAFLKLLSIKTKLVSCIYTSNVLGITNDVFFMIEEAHRVGAAVLVDAAQTIAHKKIDVHILDVDFLVFSGHKMFAPTGIGVLYAHERMHDQLSPYQTGGGMVLQVDEQGSTFRRYPHLLEAGTPPIAQAIGLHAAIRYLEEQVNFDHLAIHESSLCSRLIDGLQKFSAVKILGPIDRLKYEGHLVSFYVAGIHAHDVAAYFDSLNICVRAGNHCAQILHNRLGIVSSIRVSFAFYNTIEEVDQFIHVLHTLLDENDLLD